jgi:hypothetical protein
MIFLNDKVWNGLNVSYFTVKEYNLKRKHL